MGIYENKAIALAEKYQTANPFCICNNMEIKIEYVDLDNPLGYTIYLDKYPLLFFCLIKFKKNALCAHELGHVVLHNGIQNYYLINRTTKRKIESEADRFTMGLREVFSR